MRTSSACKKLSELELGFTNVIIGVVQEVEQKRKTRLLVSSANIKTRVNSQQLLGGGAGNRL